MRRIDKGLMMLASFLCKTRYHFGWSLAWLFIWVTSEIRQKLQETIDKRFVYGPNPHIEVTQKVPKKLQKTVDMCFVYGPNTHIEVPQKVPIRYEYENGGEGMILRFTVVIYQ